MTSRGRPGNLSTESSGRVAARSPRRRGGTVRAPPAHGGMRRAVAERPPAPGTGWSRVTATGVYTAALIHDFLVEEIRRPASPAAIHGVRWFPSRSPIQGLDVEMED
jgi:hypothetical protein